MTITPDQARELLDGATPGPWRSEYDNEIIETDTSTVLYNTDGAYVTSSSPCRKVQKGAESNAESLTAPSVKHSEPSVKYSEPSVKYSETTVTDPADVQAGEAWLVEANGKRLAALKDGSNYRPWIVVMEDGRLNYYNDFAVTLVSRLAPAPRVITNPDELDRMPEGAIILARGGEACQKTDAGDWAIAGIDGAVGYGPVQVLPVTVLWEPGA
jgi:hypothetical protein